MSDVGELRRKFAAEQHANQLTAITAELSVNRLIELQDLLARVKLALMREQPLEAYLLIEEWEHATSQTLG